MSAILTALYERMTQPAAHDNKSSPFVKIVGGKLDLVGMDIPDGDIRVMSILGKARMGKSTFLNAIVSQIEGKSAEPFQALDSDDHCTHGIDYYYCAEQKLVLMDCQGLALKNSSHDPALLLFAYLISDIIIFNERMMLQNEALKLMEPICTFMTYLDFDGLQKPKLYFRISDGQVKNIKNNLADVIHQEYADQYQSIRDSIQNLFQTDIGIIQTDALDKATRLELQTGNYAVLKNDNLGFSEAIRELLACLPKGRSAAQWKHSVPQIIEQINQNEKITIDKLDIVGQTGKLEILEWINSLTLPSEPEVDGTQASYDTNVEPLKALKKNLLTQFTRKFKAISETIKGAHRQKLTDRLQEPIQGALVKSVAKAEHRVNTFVEQAQADQEFPTINTTNASMTNTGADFFNNYFAKFRLLKRACEDVYEPVKTKYLGWLEQQESVFMKVVEECKAIETKESINIRALCSTTLEVFQLSRLMQISEMYAHNGKALVFIKPEELAKTFSEETKKSLQEQIIELLRVQKIETKIVSKGITVRKAFLITKITMNNDLVKPIYEKFCKDLDEITGNKEFLQAVTERKIALLDGYTFNGIFAASIDVPCVFLKNFDFYLTKSAYDKTYGVIYEKVFETMLKKGYVTEKDKSQLISEDAKVVHMGQHKKPHIVGLFKHTFNKTMARGGDMPTNITDTYFQELMITKKRISS